MWRGPCLGNENSLRCPPDPGRNDENRQRHVFLRLAVGNWTTRVRRYLMEDELAIIFLTTALKASISSVSIPSINLAS